MAIKDQTSLIRDLLDPDLETAEVAKRHSADPDDLRAAVRSPAFQSAAATMREVDEARTAALAPVHTARALHRLARIAAQPAETTAQTESARRAATALIRGRSALRADSSGKSSSVPNGAGCRADAEAFCTPSTNPTHTQPPPTPPAIPGRSADAEPSHASNVPPRTGPCRTTPAQGRPASAAPPTVADIIAALTSGGPPINEQPKRPAHHPGPATASELLARAGTG